jgi:hypothetical protein
MKRASGPTMHPIKRKPKISPIDMFDLLPGARQASQGLIPGRPPLHSAGSGRRVRLGTIVSGIVLTEDRDIDGCVGSDAAGYVTRHVPHDETRLHANGHPAALT